MHSLTLLVAGLAGVSQKPSQTAKTERKGQEGMNQDDIRGCKNCLHVLLLPVDGLAGVSQKLRLTARPDRKEQERMNQNGNLKGFQEVACLV